MKFSRTTQRQRNQNRVRQKVAKAKPGAILAMDGQSFGLPRLRKRFNGGSSSSDALVAS
jgi:hypothetical protein